MRRNITLSLDDHFIRQMDAAREGTPRSRWIEGLTEGGALMPAIPTREEQAQMDAEDVSHFKKPAQEPEGTPRAFERSPAPEADTQTLREEMRQIEDDWPPPEPS